MKIVSTRIRSWSTPWATKDSNCPCSHPNLVKIAFMKSTSQHRYRLAICSSDSSVTSIKSYWTRNSGLTINHRSQGYTCATKISEAARHRSKIKDNWSDLWWSSKFHHRRSIEELLLIRRNCSSVDRNREGWRLRMSTPMKIKRLFLCVNKALLATTTNRWCEAMTMPWARLSHSQPYWHLMSVKMRFLQRLSTMKDSRSRWLSLTIKWIIIMGRWCFQR